MTYCGHYQNTGAWPCTVLGKGGKTMSLLSARRELNLALRAYDRDEISWDQLRDVLQELLDQLDEALGQTPPEEAGDGEADTQATDPQAPADPETPPGLR